MKSLKSWSQECDNEHLSNLNEQERQGLKDAKQCVNGKKAVIFQTDKSKKYSIDKPEGFREDMKPHIENKTVVDGKFVTKVTNKANEITKSFVKILGIGKKSGQEKRSIGNVHVSAKGEKAVLSGLHKDHKIGRDKRPVVNGNVAPLTNV